MTAITVLTSVDMCDKTHTYVKLQLDYTACKQFVNNLMQANIIIKHL